MTITRHVRLFRNGVHQAVPIPRDMELGADEAILRREGNRLVMEPVPASPLLALLATLKPIDDDFSDVDAGLPRTDDIRCEQGGVIERVSARAAPESRELAGDQRDR